MSASVKSADAEDGFTSDEEEEQQEEPLPSPSPPPPQEDEEAAAAAAREAYAREWVLRTLLHEEVEEAAAAAAAAAEAEKDVDGCGGSTGAPQPKHIRYNREELCDHRQQAVKQPNGLNALTEFLPRLGPKPQSTRSSALSAAATLVQHRYRQGVAGVGCGQTNMFKS